MKNRLFKNDIELKTTSEGKERQIELLRDILDNGTFLPKTVLHQDIDEAFKQWVEDDLKIVSDEGNIMPTMTLYSNQRFSEYSQSWEYVDSNKNLILNFKTVTRENNPKDGTIQGGLWNIPGEHWFLMKRQIVLDDNGDESFLDLKMKQPMALDMVYKISLFTTKYSKINEFNTIVNDKFKSRQCYIWPNNHPMPMVLDIISDESSYQIDDRQFYCQTYKIKVMAYIITEDIMKIEEVPMRKKVNFNNLPDIKRNLADVEIDDENDIILTIIFPNKCNKAEFTIDCDCIIDKNEKDSIQFTNILGNYKMYINGNQVVKNANKITFKNGDKIKIIIDKIHKDKQSVIVMTDRLKNNGGN